MSWSFKLSPYVVHYRLEIGYTKTGELKRAPHLTVWLKPVLLLLEWYPQLESASLFVALLEPLSWPEVCSSFSAFLHLTLVLEVYLKISFIKYPSLSHMVQPRKDANLGSPESRFLKD